MRLVIQRVSRAAVAVGGADVSRISRGLMILVGVEQGDTPADIEWLAAKVARLRIFEDESGVMNLSVMDIKGEVMAISQFTLTASTRKGNRPSYIRAERPEVANGIYDDFCRQLAEMCGTSVAKGVFGADMKVELVNDGPVTIIIDSRLRE